MLVMHSLDLFDVINVSAGGICISVPTSKAWRCRQHLYRGRLFQVSAYDEHREEIHKNLALPLTLSACAYMHEVSYLRTECKSIEMATFEN